MKNIFKIVGYILIGILIGAASMYIKSCNERKEDIPKKIFDSTDVANAREEGYFRAKAEIFEKQAIEYKLELDAIRNKEIVIKQNNTQYKTDYSKKSPSETDAEFLEWVKKHSL